MQGDTFLRKLILIRKKSFVNFSMVNSMCMECDVVFDLVYRSHALCSSQRTLNLLCQALPCVIAQHCSIFSALMKGHIHVFYLFVYVAILIHCYIFNFCSYCFHINSKILRVNPLLIHVSNT